MEDNKDAQIIEQFVQNVEDFSSQYCSDLSETQTKFDLRGPPSNFPDSGNYYHRYVMRTYGPWWDEAPSFQEDYTPLNSGRIQSHDFVEVSFERAVYPLEVAVFETFNPGALVRIWALGLRSWVLLWEGEPENVGHTPRIFSPPIREVDFTTRILRLEFNHKLLPYYTELAAVLLKGKEPTNLIKRKSNSGNSFPFFKRSKPAIEKGVLLKEPSNLMPKDVNVDTGPPLGDFHRLPDETILSVFKYLDMQSLCRCAQVNKLFRRIACDAILYPCIDLRSYWHCLRSEVLVTLSMKCKFLQKLDLSWCGSHYMMQPRFVVNFLRQSGANLTHLRMNCCKFVDNSVLKAIVDTSSNLQELCLGSVVSCSEWSYLAYLTKLKRLYLYRTNISTSAAVAVVRSNPGLQHLNVGYCNMISPLDEVAIALGSNCPDLMSVDFSSAHSLTAVGFRALENCKKLQEVDLGWCRERNGRRRQGTIDGITYFL